MITYLPLIIIVLIIIILILIINLRKLQNKIFDINSELDSFIESEEFDNNFALYLNTDGHKENSADHKIDHLVKEFNDQLIQKHIVTLEKQHNQFQQWIDMNHPGDEIEKHLQQEDEIAQHLQQEDEIAQYLQQEDEIAQHLQQEDEIAQYLQQEDGNQRALEQHIEMENKLREDIAMMDQEQKWIAMMEQNYNLQKFIDQQMDNEELIAHEEKLIDEYNDKQIEEHEEKLIDDHYSIDRPKKLIQQNYKVKSTVFNEVMKKWNIECLYHMTHLVNIRSIFDHNLLSHNLAHQGDYIQVDISISTVNQRRNRSEPIFNKNIHSYVPLYFNIKNPMLYVRKSMDVNIVILKINKNVLNKKKVLFSNGNAASRKTQFYSQLNQLDNLHWECIRDRFWHDYNDGKRTKCSEVLVPDMVEISHIEGIICNNTTTLNQLKILLPKEVHHKIVNNPQYYF